MSTALSVIVPEIGSDLAIPVALTATHISALRRADTVCFDHDSDRGSWIRCIKRLKPTAADPFQPEERTIAIKCASRVHAWTDMTHTTPIAIRAYVYLGSAQYDDEWKTIASLIRAGDTLMLSWHRGGLGSPFLRERGLVGDYLQLLVFRKERPVYTFRIDNYVGADNSARMTKAI
jgi:hypothetical protein